MRAFLRRRADGSAGGIAAGSAASRAQAAAEEAAVSLSSLAAYGSASRLMAGPWPAYYGLWGLASAAAMSQRIDRLALLGRRIRGGADFWAVVSEAEAGVAICRRLSSAEGYFSWAKRKGGFPAHRAADVAAALDIPEAWVPVRRHPDVLALAGQDVLAGAEFFRALADRKAGGALSRLLGLNSKAVQIWRVRTGAIPPRHLAAVAKALAVPPERLPVSRGCWHPPLSREQQRVMLEARLKKMGGGK